jgi:hypothetical protein
MEEKMDNEIATKEFDVKAQNTDMKDALVNRQMAEVQAQMVLAKRFPRDEYEAFNKIRKACKRKGLAEQAEYSYPKGGTKVTGPGIRLMEAIAHNWGNISYGTIELSRSSGKSEMMAYCWDLENNVRRTQTFTVEHVRDTRAGLVKLNNTRDIYEMTANMGARRVRACIMAVIPGDIVDDAVKECKKTLSDSYEEPLKERLKTMIATFDDKHGVNKQMIEEFFGYNLESLSENDFIKLRSIYNSLKDGLAKRGDFFKMKMKANSVFDKELVGDKKEGEKC